MALVFLIFLALLAAGASEIVLNLKESQRQ